MKRYILIYFCWTLFVPLISFSQESYVDSLENWIKENPTIDSQYIVNLHKLSYRTSETDVVASFKYYEKVSELSDQLHFTFGKALAEINLGLLLSNSGNFGTSNDAFFDAIKFAEECGADRLKAISLNNIGENFLSLNDLRKCQEYCQKAIQFNTRIKAWRGVAVNYELLQRSFLKEKRYLQAKQNLDTGFPYALQSGDSYIISAYDIGFGKYHAHFKQYDSARFYFEKAMQEAEIEDDMRNIYEVYMARVIYLDNLSRNKKVALLDNAFTIASQTKFLEGIGRSAEMLSQFYDGEGNKDSSLHYFHIYRSSYDSIFSENNRRNVIIKEANWMLKKKEIENTHLLQISEIQKKELVFKNALLLAVFVLSGLLVLITLVIYRNGKVARMRAISEFQRKVLDLRMQSLQAHMNPHFIFNCLNSIENFIMRNEKREASDYLLKFSTLIRIILDVNRLELVPFEKNLEALKLYIELEQLRFNNKFKFIIDIDENLHDPEYRVPSLLIQPYVENAIIHGLAPSDKPDLYLHISASIHDDCIEFIIEDNGIGRLQASKYKQQNKPNHKSIGLLLTQEKIDIFNLQHQARSEVKFIDLFTRDGQANGTRVIVKIKIV